MIYFSHIRTGLIASALLLTTALANPAVAESLPEISPRQIASDVEVKFNPETGEQEYIAPSFDPFEEDPSMAGTASLRSVNSATAIDGQSVRGGALLDMTFYYNSTSNDPYDTRGYEEAVYLSGEYAPVTRRNNRILECNENIQDVVYYHEEYYRPSYHENLYRPYRHYRGHYRFDRFYDFGLRSGLGRGFRGSSLRGRRGFRNRNGLIGRRGFLGRDRDRSRDRNRDRERDRGRNRDTDENRDGDRSRDRDRSHDRNGERRRNRYRSRGTESSPHRVRGRLGSEVRRERRLERDRRVNRNQTRDDNRTITAPRGETRRARGAPRNQNANRDIRRGNRQSRNVLPQNNSPVESGPRTTARSSASRPAPTPGATPASRPSRAARTPRRERTDRSRPPRAERGAGRASHPKSRNASKRSFGGSRGGKRGTKLKMIGFLPMASSWSRNVVRNVDVQCAREEMLTVHVSQERLDAARFDGLTILVLGRTGQEIPVFVPPNYIEGFRQAVNGRVAPSGSYKEPITRGPVYQEPRPYSIEEAPCPVGTTKQSDGTCLQGSTTTYEGYPTR